MTKGKKKVKKTENIDDSILEIALGGLLIGTNSLNDGIVLEKIFFVLGFVIYFVGIIRSIIKYKQQDKKGMMILLVVIGILSLILLGALLYNLFF